MPVLALAYLPDAAFSAQCEDYARHLTEAGGRQVCLGPEALAHLSLVHVDGLADARSTWHEAIDLLPTSLTINTADLYFGHSDSTYNGEGNEPGVFCGVAVVNTPEVAAAERAALDLPAVRYANVLSANGPRYFPHITLGRMKRVPADVDLQSRIFKRDGIVCRLAMGPLGPHGVFQRIDYIAGGD